MSSQRYTETRTVREENRLGNNGYDMPINSRINVPIEYSVNKPHEERAQELIRQRNTNVQWVNDSFTGAEKFRVTINIEGFHQNEVNMRVDGNKLVVYGEHIVNQNQSTEKKIIEKSYELPRDIDIHSPQVTYPTAITMQIDFPSRHSNVIIDDGRLSKKLVSDYDTSYRAPTGFSREKSSSEFTSTRKIGGGNGVGSLVSGGFERSSNPRIYSSYERLFDNATNGLDKTYSTDNYYQARKGQIATRRGLFDSTTDSFNTSKNPTCTYRLTGDDIQPITTFASTSRGNNSDVIEKTFSETHRETHHQRSSPTTGVQSSHEVEHKRSGSPSLAKSLDDDRFRTNFTIGGSSIAPLRPLNEFERHRSNSTSIGKTLDDDRFRTNFTIGGSSIAPLRPLNEFERHRSNSTSIGKTLDDDRFRANVTIGGGSSITPPRSSRNVEIREYSRRVGGGANNNNYNFINDQPSLFTQGFNPDAFYRSAFQPQVFVDDRGQNRIEMKLDVQNYKPNEIKVSVSGNDLIVKAEHNVERPPTSSIRSSFFKQITLPPNTDLGSVSSQYHPDGKLNITANLLNEKASIGYN
ncbi:unnamed protein product [Rotaria magnacalcarata]|uniref:SHSP domain-containing protein n=1 Tax=Rotaria magnacalcarata TaxID=392030 RepID=A0A819ZL64_9BILA|nr:unnamed protein product [Rotaria magnacalcarata]CAF2238801.1 unnamed protein product [Rotaria magnacalcarata]CAF4139565.1 unnamed protein product [Rotaria magnacalcarata]CAF4171658.1 unnamed protein product [Rotaria magnacalcarata]